MAVTSNDGFGQKVDRRTKGGQVFNLLLEHLRHLTPGQLKEATAELAARLDLSPVTIQSWLQGRKPVIGRLTTPAQEGWLRQKGLTQRDEEENSLRAALWWAIAEQTSCR